MFHDRVIIFQKKVNEILLVHYYYIKMPAALHMSRYSEYSTEC